MVKAVLFDFNGIIIDDERLQCSAFQGVLGPYGLELTEQQYFAALGMDDRTFIRTQFELAEKPIEEVLVEEIIEKKFELHRSALEEQLPLFPGVLNFVKHLSNRYDLGLVSMASRVEVDYVLERSGLKSSFGVVVSAEDVKECKPNPECYLRGLEFLNEARRARNAQRLVPRQVLAIEDSPAGIHASRSAGMRTLGVTNSVGAEELRNAGAEIVTKSLADWNSDAIHHLYDE